MIVPSAPRMCAVPPPSVDSAGLSTFMLPTPVGEFSLEFSLELLPTTTCTTSCFLDEATAAHASRDCAPARTR